MDKNMSMSDMMDMSKCVDQKITKCIQDHKDMCQNCEDSDEDEGDMMEEDMMED